MIMTRRQYLGSATAGLGLLALPRQLFAGTTADEPHYMLQVVFEGGWDPSYLCDARPLAMTAAGRIQNYLAVEPEMCVGPRGGQALCTPLFKPLLPFLQDGHISILNGVLMAATSPGHEQNMNFLFTGNPFGGESFIPYLNRRVPGLAPRALDILQLGALFGVSITNQSASVTLAPAAASSLSAAARDTGPLDPSAPSIAFFRQRLARYATGEGRFARGMQQMRDGFAQADDLATRMRDVSLPNSEGQDDLPQKLALMQQYFTRGISKACVLTVSRYPLDTHDPESAKGQVTMYPKIAADMATILHYLRSTPVSETDSRSLLDVTTVVFTSEFSRTMRQLNLPTDNTGTDHNPLSNTVILAGKGVRGGHIIGASDQNSVAPEVSDAHKQLDQMLMQVMGLPFDFDRLSPRQDRPSAYVPEHYLSFASVVNSLMQLFGVPSDNYWTLSRSGPKARLLSGIIG